MTTRFSQYLDNLNKKTLYVHRPLINADKVIEWAKSKGCKTCLKPESMHVTLLYSKTPMIWPQPNMDIVRVYDFVSSVQQFDGGALVLHFHWLPFNGRHIQLIAAGGTSDYPDYKSHITLTYEGEGLDPKSFGQYEGDLLFGPEVFKEIDLEKKWKNSSLEEAKAEQSDYLVEADDFGKHVKKTMSSDAAYKILDSHPSVAGSTWNAGGCGILAHAIHRHIPGSKLVDVHNKRTGKTEHMAVQFSNTIYDGRGVSSARDYTKKFAKHELKDHRDLELRDHDPTLAKKSEINIPKELVDKTHELLKR